MKSTFFEFGTVELEAEDKDTRQASLRICMPACLMQTVTPSLLGSGLIDEHKVRNPLVIWIPILEEERYIENALQRAPNLLKIVSHEMKETVIRVEDFFCQLSKILKDPSDIIPILPMGVYVTFRYRCNVDRLASILIQLENINVVGVPDIRYALAEVLAFILQNWAKPGS